MKALLIILASLISLTSLAQPGHKIDLEVKGLADTTVLLAYYYGESTYVKDTARVDKNGKFTFQGKERIPQGVYFIVLNKSSLFDMVIGEKQHFSLETSTGDYVKNMKVKGDDDNRLFYENMIYNMEKHKQADPLIKILRDSSLNEDQKKEARESFQKINNEVTAYQDDMMAKHPSTLTARMLRATRPVIVPEAPVKADGTIDSTFRLRYYRKHFFDNFNLADDAMIRLPKPYYQEKLTEYLDKLFLQTPDSLTAAIDGLAASVKKNQEAYKYLVWTCIYKYQKPEIMGLDEVYVRLYDRYYASGEMDFWVGSSLKKNLKEYADKLRISLIGKTGPNLSMQDEHFQQKSLYDIKKKYTIVYFFDPDCGHCREESPKLVSFYDKNKNRFNVEIFAVSADTSMQKMRNYIKEMKMTWITVNGPRSYVGQYGKLYYAETTPTLYVLDDKKKIIAKGLAAEKLEDFFTNYERYLQRKAAVKPKGT